MKMGPCAARNAGIQHSTAPYISFLDSDDYYEPDAVANLLALLEKSDSDVAVGSIRVIYKDRRFTAIEKNNDKQYYMVKLQGAHDITAAILKKTDVSSCNKLIKRSIIEQHGTDAGGIGRIGHIVDYLAGGIDHLP